jgi:hypothetical protein
MVPNMSNLRCESLSKFCIFAGRKEQQVKLPKITLGCESLSKFCIFAGRKEQLRKLNVMCKCGSVLRINI